MVATASPVPGPKAPIAVPALLAFVAGAVDACTFLALFGLFVAQLTGSFITVGVQIVKRDPGALIHLLALPLFFVAGVAIALLTRSLTTRALALALAIETVLLTAFMAAGLEGTPFTRINAPATLVTSALGLLAMGVQSATVRLMLPGVASTNVMTINTTQLAIDVAQWLIAAFATPAGDARAAAARRIAVLGPIMAAFFGGSALGAIGFSLAGFWSLAVLIGILSGLVAWALRTGGRHGSTPAMRP
jgi:uncharacterized membrane protein YoaK (UPF0700 family)